MSSFKSLKRCLSRGREEVKEDLNGYCFMNFWKRTKEGITNQTKVHRELGPWHTDAQTSMSFCRVRQLAYVAYIRTPNFNGVHMILDMRTFKRTLIFSLSFLKFFKIFLVFMILYCLLVTAIYLTFNLFVCLWKR